jgi:hypothetical protein
MSAKIIAVLFLSRDLAHREHLRTKSYSAHVALNSFYLDVITQGDRLAEACQGRHGLIEDIPLLGNDTGKTAIVDILQSLLDLIESLRYSEYDREDTSLQAIIDDIVELYLTTLYKLKNLR